MTGNSFDCPACGASIEPEEVLAVLAQRGSAHNVIEDKQDVEMRCPECREDVVLEAAEIVVRLSADDATLAVFREIAEEGDGFAENYSPDLEKAVEQQRESRKRHEELKELFQSL